MISLLFVFAIKQKKRKRKIIPKTFRSKIWFVMKLTSSWAQSFILIDLCNRVIELLISVWKLCIKLIKSDIPGCISNLIKKLEGKRSYINTSIDLPCERIHPSIKQTNEKYRKVVVVLINFSFRVYSYSVQSRINI